MPVCGSEVFPIAYEKNEKVLALSSKISANIFEAKPLNMYMNLGS